MSLLFLIRICSFYNSDNCPVFGNIIIGNEMRKTEENYQRIKDDRRLFDIRFWQSQGDLAIFEAVAGMLNDYFLIRGKNADESRLQRTIENFRKV